MFTFHLKFPYKCHFFKNIPKRFYWQGRDIFGCSATEKPSDTLLENEGISSLNEDNEKGINSLINAYRRYGHLQAAIDPLNLGCRGRIPELNPNLYGLEKDENEVVSTIERLNKIYSGNIGIQFMHLKFFWGGAHRGRLALQNVLFQYPTGQLFRKHSDFYYKTINDNNVHVSTLPNPSHLEATIATLYGKARARAQTLRIGDYGGQVVGEGILAVHHHGDGAFTGQGIVWEALSMSQVPNFRIGGSIHLIVNNQLAFTADKNIGRSSIHCGNVALAIDCPLICVNAENILEVIKAAKIALKYRQIFRKEIFVELICYRRYGHNELDEPRFTQPSIHPTLQKSLVNSRLEKIQNGNIDWSTAESLAIGSALLQGFDVRLSGQDVGRGTFSQRHAMLVCQQTDKIANSPLSEAAVVGFEYGFAIENPKRLVIWEAQFGDFYNGAQVQIDTLIASKWFLQNGLVLLLPHGFDGAGPDHSSAHIERFLSLTDSSESQLVPDGDNINMRIITPYRKPLVIITPKLLLRHSFSSSPIEDFVEGTSFQPVLFDKTIKENKNIKKVIICSGKHSLTLFNERSKREICDTAIVRLEEICPFPVVDLAKIFDIYSNAKSFIWSQEEPRNAGCWPFIQNRFKNAFGIELKYAGRAEQAWIATSIAEVHEKEVLDILEETFS
uniref:Transketolase-like pyrimidine-binding domain-containing protein n=1 Tax=Meloidogyne javanica TaxID=6303 RepID=A0A915MEQ2_MELJA